MLKKLALGSTSPHKYAAVKAALGMAQMPDVEVIRVDALSGIDAQPIGGDLAALGAENRARDAVRKTARDVTYGIGIESGVELRRGVWLDIATVVLVQHDVDKPIALATSIGIPVPAEDVLLALSAGIRTNTAGGAFALRTGQSATDWHSSITGGRISREDQLTEAVYAALIQVW